MQKLVRQSKRHCIQRFEELKGQEGPAAKQSVDIALNGSRLGKKVLELKDVTKKIWR
ncbi:hypothetical protein ACT7CW_28675 [Bacillus pacificus]